MPDDHLTTGEFTRWAVTFNEQLNAIRQDITPIRDDVAEHGAQLAVLEDRANRAYRVHGTIAAFVGGIMSAAVTYLTGAPRQP